MQQHISIQLGIAWMVVALIIGIILLVTAPPQMTQSGASATRPQARAVSSNELNNSAQTLVKIYEQSTEKVEVAARVQR
ncbi:MAG: hypothetical protein COU35_05165 [Candidatus Magasanikbacteria bacterium CG10_big_fil_rev_8_21_14_0_10_47_10]|uniref:Uncharacterized protein n=1 Tax=Candidatus Magasanikbacteria bacterium CG10_big_fil_rev_8_21_14_0_10_47_10 TaxID=1974652 RepID=A0A2H0TP55_9BACT|nr:MAG: hypothetical protein COU35_05165 [Candidatus Magasanikbacteria bacterium CG10_big_fil_rev_8_21_14_0_10_47_10]